jgi:hypothetical protein
MAKAEHTMMIEQAMPRKPSATAKTIILSVLWNANRRDPAMLSAATAHHDRTRGNASNIVYALLSQRRIVASGGVF